MSLRPPVGRDDHRRGPLDAPITLVEYGDHECGYCGEAYPAIRSVQNALGDRLCFVFRNFPMGEAHPHAVHAAELAEAAAAAGRFWPMHDLLFENQEALADESLYAYGEQIGLDRDDIAAALAGRFAQRIQQDFLSGVRSGVNGTPSLFINGERYDGARDAETLYAVLTGFEDGR